MADTPFVVERFGGLNLIDDPEEVGFGGAVALSDVTFDLPGRVRNRDGSKIVSQSATTNAITGGSYYLNAIGGEFMAVTDGSTTTVFDLSTGISVATQSATLPNGNNSFARFGDPSNTRLYMADTASSNIHRFDGIALVWTDVTAPAAASLLTVTNNDNRLAFATTSSAKVYFSDAGAPETFGTNNFVSLTPGDGESLTGLVSWRELTFAFKQTKFFVFTGVSVDSTGNPVFNYRTVAAGQGCSPGAVVAGDDGVYFANSRGVYVTTGDVPVYLSRALEPWIAAGSASGMPSISLTSASLAYFGRKLYVNDSTNRTTLVYDTVQQTWTVWLLAATAVFSIPASSTHAGLQFGENSTKKIWKMDSTVATDNGVAVSWSYTSGAYDLSGKNLIATTRESVLWGTGTVTLQVANNHGSVDAGSSLTLGSSPAVAEGWQQIDREGVWWQHKLSGSGAATINRLVHYVSFVRGSDEGN